MVSSVFGSTLDEFGTSLAWLVQLRGSSVFLGIWNGVGKRLLDGESVLLAEAAVDDVSVVVCGWVGGKLIDLFDLNE